MLNEDRMISGCTMHVGDVSEGGPGETEQIREKSGIDSTDCFMTTSH